MTLKAAMSKGTVEHFLSQQEGLSHLRVRTLGSLLTIESIDEQQNVYPCARLRKKSVHLWYLEMPVRRGWESTFIEGTITELMKILVEKFPWVLTCR